MYTVGDYTYIGEPLEKRGGVIIILLCGGDKSTQAKDIQTAKRLAAEWSEEHG